MVEQTRQQRTECRKSHHQVRPDVVHDGKDPDQAGRDLLGGDVGPEVTRSAACIKALDNIAGLVAACRVRVPIAATYPVGDIRAAVELQAARHVRGTVTIDLCPRRRANMPGAAALRP